MLISLHANVMKFFSGEDGSDRKKRFLKRSGSKRSLLLDDLANDDITSFGYDKRA